MGISKVSNRWLNRTYKAIAIFLVIFAVLISALRLFLPYAHNYRLDLQAYLNNTYESNILIGSLHMDWQSSGPSLVANNVSLLQTDASEVYIKAFEMNVDFWKSLRYRRFITKDFTLDGVKVLFDKNLFATRSNTSQDALLIDNISELFLKQIGQFSVNNSQVIVRTSAGERTFLIDQLDWLNQGDQHKAHGEIILDGITSNTLQVNLSVKGEVLSEMQGTLFIAAKKLDITPWLDSVLAIDNEKTHSTINFDAWLSIENGLAEQLHVSLGDNQVAWQVNESIRTFNIDQGDILFSQLNTSDKISIQSSDVLIRSNEDHWDPLYFSYYQNNDSKEGYVSTFNIAGVADFLPLFIAQDDVRNLIEKLNPVGEVRDAFFRYADNELSANAQFSRLTTLYSDGIPGISNVNGEIILSDNYIQMTINAKDGELDFNKHFKAPIPYQSLSATVNVQHSEKAWSLTSDSIDFVSEQLKLTAEMGVFSSNNAPVKMSLLATAVEGNALFAETFYPHLLMGGDLVDYLNGSLQKGSIEQALVLVNGPLDRFPYGDGSGIFTVDAELTDGTFKFDSDWPAIKHFNANLNFTNNSMMITGRDGSLSGIDVRGVTTSIADLSDEQILVVDANFQDTAPELVTNLMLVSPFDDSVGKVLEHVVIDKNIAGLFSLNIPLNNNKLTEAKGKITFNNNDIALQGPEMHFAQVNGDLTFINERIFADDLQLTWRGMPMSLDVNAYDKEQHYQTDITIYADWKKREWQAQLPDLLKPYSDGSLNWQGQLAIKHFHDGQFSYDFAIKSDLLATKLDLPAPFNKDINEKNIANIKVFGNEELSNIEVKVGKTFNFNGNLNHEKVSFSQAHLLLGKEEMYLPVSGFHITTHLAEANFEQWQPFIRDLISSLPSDDTAQEGHEKTQSLLAQPQRIRGDIAKVNFIGESIHDVSFNLEDELSWWLLSLSSKEARGKVKFFPNWHNQGLAVDADFIHLSPNTLLLPTKDADDTLKTIKNTNLDTLESIDKTKEGITQIASLPFDINVNNEIFSDIPPLQVSCKQCAYGNLNFGHVSFSIEREKSDLLKLNNFVAKRKKNKLSFDGQWQHNESLSRTKLTGEFQSKDIEREFEQLGMSSTIRDSGLKSYFDLNWQGGPQNFALAHFNGDFNAQLDEGYLAEVPDKARAFSILSLQSLIRKLKFDFRDIFSDGMFYSEIKGDFHVKNGVIYTKNTFLKGSAGDLSIKGNTDLNTEILDYSMSYKPNFSSSLPAIAWIAFANPVAFLAGIAIDEVITSNVVSEYKIEVTGSIEEPSVKVVDRKTKNISVGRDSPPKVVENMPINEKKTLGVMDPETGLIEDIEQQPSDNNG